MLRYWQEYYRQNRERIRAVSKKYRREHIEQAKAYEKEYRERLGTEKISEVNFSNNQKRKGLVLTHYGNGKLACVRCGFDDIRALSIDHLNAGGSQERKGKKLGGSNFYRWLVKNNYPGGYQTLCMNCNWIKRAENKET